MQQAQIIPQYINQPKDPSWKNGSVKDTNGQLWTVDKAALGMFQPGGAFTVTYDPPFGNRKYPTILSVNGQQVGASQSAGFTPAGQAAQAPLPQQGSWQPQTAQSAPAAAPAPSTPMPDTLLSNVLATAVEKGAIQSPSELEIWARAIAVAHKVYHGQLPEHPAQQGTGPGPAPGPEIAGGLQRLADHHSAAHGGGQGGPPAGHPAGALIDDMIPFAPLKDLP